MKSSPKKMRYIISIVAVYVAFVVYNRFYFSREFTCSDCFFLYGVPFAYFNEGGFAGGAGYIWSGGFADGILIVVCGVVIAKAWGWLIAKFSK